MKTRALRSRKRPDAIFTGSMALSSATSISAYGVYMLKLLGTEEHKRNKRVNEQQIGDSETVPSRTRARARECAVSGVSVGVPHGVDAALAGSFLVNSADRCPRRLRRGVFLSYLYAS